MYRVLFGWDCGVGVAWWLVCLIIMYLFEYGDC